MSNSNFTLKNPHKIYILQVVTNHGAKIFYLPVLKPTYSRFWFFVGQFIQREEIRSIKYIGVRLIKDHWGNDIEETFADSNRVFPQELIESFNNEFKNYV